VSAATEATAHLVSTAGKRVSVEISAVPLKDGERVVGVFGLIEGRLDDTPTAPPPHLTPRQVEVLRLPEQGRSTKQIAAELHARRAHPRSAGGRRYSRSSSTPPTTSDQNNGQPPKIATSAQSIGGFTVLASPL
jgi:hypothetical protein